MTLQPLSIPEPQPFDRLLTLQGKCAVVTGGSRGIGEAIVRRLVQAGAAVVLTGRGVEALQRVESQITATGGQALAVQADISTIEDSQKVLRMAVERFGQLDILVNNAAVFPGSSALDMTEEIWDQTFDADLRGAFFACKLAAEAMIAAGHGGRIINVLSTAAFKVASPLVAYGAAKAGLWYVTQALAQELAEHRILVNAVTPGATMTVERISAIASGTLVQDVLGAHAAESMTNPVSALDSSDLANMISRLTPLGRPGYPDDIATAVLFLASPMASYISGVNITADGGQTLKGMDLPDTPEVMGNADSDQGTGVLDQELQGTYTATVTTPMGTQEVVFSYNVDGSVLTGTISFAGNTVPIQQGKATATGFTHQLQMRSPMGNVNARVEARLDGDKIVGNLMTPMGSIPFEAARVGEATNLRQ